MHIAHGWEITQDDIAGAVDGQTDLIAGLTTYCNFITEKGANKLVYLKVCANKNGYSAIPAYAPFIAPMTAEVVPTFTYTRWERDQIAKKNSSGVSDTSEGSNADSLM